MPVERKAGGEDLSLREEKIHKLQQALESAPNVVFVAARDGAQHTAATATHHGTAV
jgi:hypothetical protein